MKTLKNNKLLVSIILSGIILRLLIALFMNQIFDYLNILAIVKSVADTGNILEGFFVIKRTNFEIQLYGKIYYQIAAAWMLLLQKIRILDIAYLFDTKPFQNSASYMVGFKAWGTPMYQLVAIKLVQFVYDCVYGYYFYKIAEIIKPSKKLWALLFWAINPFIVFIAFGNFQSDLAMISMLVAATYYYLKSFNTNHRMRNRVISLGFLALGAVIKQVPMLMAPFFILMFAESLISFAVYCLTFGIWYGILSQPWAADASLVKLFFFNSKESLALFNFELNGTPVFLFLFFTILIIFTLQLKRWKQKPAIILYLIPIILSCIYISEDSRLFYSNFSTWIMPFLAILTLVDEQFGIFMIVPVIAFIKRSTIDNDFFGGALSVSLGSALNNMMKYPQFLMNVINPLLLQYVLNSAVIVMYAFVLIYLLLNEEFLGKKFTFVLPEIKVNLKIVSLSLFVIYFAFLAFDFLVKSRFVYVYNPQYKSSEKLIPLEKKPLKVTIINPQQKAINAIDIMAKRNDIFYNDYVVLKFTDLKTGTILLTQKVSDYIFPNVADTVTIRLNKELHNEAIQLEISKEKNLNTVFVTKADVVSQTFSSPSYLTMYDDPNQISKIQLKFPSTSFEIRFRGPYSFSAMFGSFIHNVQMKPKFYTGYLGLIVFLFVALLALRFV